MLFAEGYHPDKAHLQYMTMTNFVLSLAYHRAFNRFGYKDRKHLEFINHTQSVYFESIVIEWCKLYGANGEDLHWKRTFGDKDYYRNGLIKMLGVNEGYWEKYWAGMVDYRNLVGAHVDFSGIQGKNFVMNYDIAYISIKYFFNNLNQQLKRIGFPSHISLDLDLFYENSLRDGEAAIKAISEDAKKFNI